MDVFKEACQKGMWLRGHVGETTRLYFHMVMNKLSYMKLTGQRKTIKRKIISA